MKTTRSEKREQLRRKKRNAMPSLADQVKRGPVRTKSATVHVRKKV